MIRALVFLAALPLTMPAAAALPDAAAMIAESARRHAYPDALYEEQTLILSDGAGQHAVRSLRHYLRRDGAGVRRALVLDAPVELRGTAVHFGRGADGRARTGPHPASPLFGSDFSLADLDADPPDAYRYRYERAQDIGRVPHHIVRATPAEGAGRVAERRIYLRKDNLFVTRIEHLDRQGGIQRRHSFRDPRPDESGAWRAGMVLMEDLQNHRRSLIKVDRRIHSADYVPESIFRSRP